MRILKDNLASFHLYHADCIGVESNCLYPHAVEVADVDSLVSARFFFGTEKPSCEVGVGPGYHYNVRYTDQNGLSREALLTNTYTRRKLVPGDPVKIKYLPGKENEAVMV